MVNLSNKVISSYKIVKGAKAGEKPRKPNIAVDSVSSISTAKILYGLNDGEISGIVGGGKGIKLEDTPLEDDNGNSNFEGVKWDFRSGTIDQEYIEGFPDISNETPVSVELKDSVAWVKSISNPVLSAVRIRLAWNGLKQQNIDNGDVSGYRIDYAIDLKTGSGAYTEVLNTNINDKVSGKYERTHRIELPKSANGWLIRVRRITPNANKENIQDKMFVESITEVIDQKFRYPHTSLLGIQYDAKTFSRIAKLAVRARGKLIKIPTNYNTTNNTYTGIWNGQFKLAYSNNPAWIFYDLVTSKRYGLGKRIDASMIDKWSLYELGTYCDALVDDGQGGKEKRYTCNVYIQSQVDAYKILSQLSGIFRGITYWNGQQLVISADVPKDPTYTFSRANVIDGNFEYTGTRARDRHTVAKVAFDNPNENYKTEYELVRDEAAIAKFGINILDISAIGCTSRGQAQRAGLWALKSEQLETRTVTFRTGLEGFNVAVGEVIEVSDELLAGRANGGRITAVGADLKTITLDRDAIVKVNDFITVNTKDGNSQRRKVIAVTGKTITLLTSFVGIDTGSVWAVSSSDLKTMQFRIMAIKPDENNIYTITAMQYEPLKYDAVDKGANVKPTDISINKPSNIVEAPTPVYVSANYRVVQAQTVATLIIQWSQVKDAVSYLVEWRKDSGNWIQIPATGNVSAEVDGVYGGLYQARVKAVNAIQASSTYAYSSITTVKSKLSEPKALINLTATGILFGITLNWLFSEGSEDSAYTEVEVATDDLGTNTALVGQFSYPTDNHTINGLQGDLKLFYRARTVDKFGNASEWTAYASATVDASADKVLDLLEGQITESQLYQDLRTKIDLSGTNAVDISGVKTDIAKANADIAAANATLDKAKADILATDGSLAIAKGELATAKTDITKAKADITAAKSVADLAKTDSEANKLDLIAINEAVGINKAAVEVSITSLVNKDLALSNLYTALKSEYDTNKASVSQDLTTLTNKDISLSSLLTALDTDYQGNKTAIRNELTAVSTKTDSTANSLTSLTTEVGNNKTAITTEATTRSTEDTALSNRITTVSGKTDNALSRITTAETTIANNTGAITQQKTDITAAYKKAIDNIQVGAKNLLPTTYSLYSAGTYQYYKYGVAGESYIVSVTDRDTSVNVTGCNLLVTTETQPYEMYTYIINNGIILNNNFITNRPYVGIYPNTKATFDKIFARYNIKIEKGNKVTDWTAAPEDVEASITAAITRESTARTSAVEAVANTVTALDSRFEGNKATVANSLTTLTNKDTSLANSITALTTTVGNNTTAISTESTARSTADTAIGNRITTVEGKTDNALSRVSTVETIAADNKQSIASTKTDLQAEFKALNAVKDTRNDNFTPSYYMINHKASEVKEFKAAATIGLPSNTNYYYLVTLVKYGDFSGGNIVQTAYSDSNNIYIRASTNGDNWAAWVEQESTQGAIDKVAEAKAALNTLITANTAAITNESTVRANEDTALSNRITTVNAKTDNALSRIATSETAISDTKQALTQAKTDITAEYKTAIDKIEVGGRNLLSVSSIETRDTSGNTVLNNYVFTIDGTKSNFYKGWLSFYTVGDSKDYILSFKVRKDSGSILTVGGHAGGLYIHKVLRNGINVNSPTGQWLDSSYPDDNVYYEYNIFFRDSNVPVPLYIQIGRGDGYSTLFKATIKDIILERGNIATGWKPSVEDINSEITNTKAAITSEATTRANEDGALSTRITNTEAVANNAQARVGTVETAVATNTGAIASQTSQVSAALRATKVLDTRNENQPPSYYWANHALSVVKEFKNSSVMGIGIGNYLYLDTLVKWSDSSGGAINQTAVTDANITFTRISNGTTAWSSWVRQEDEYSTNNKITAAVQVESTARADAVRGLYAQYTVKLDVGGRVSGFGLASTGKTSDFSINADNFYIAPPTGSSKGGLPFMVTNGTTINGISVPAGTYIRDAYIANGSIGTAKIGKLAVDSLQIADYAVSLPVYVDNPNQQNIGYGTSPVAGWVTIAKATFPSVGASATITLGIDSLDSQAAPQPNNAPYYSVYVGIFRNGVEMKRYRMTNYRSEVTGGFITKDTLLYFPTLMDTQKTAETVVYEAKVLGENFHIRGGGSWGSFTNFIRVGALSFTVMAMKK